MGEPPFPPDPIGGDPGGGLPSSVKSKLGTINAKLRIPTANAAPAWKFAPLSYNPDKSPFEPYIWAYRYKELIFLGLSSELAFSGDYVRVYKKGLLWRQGGKNWK